ncbi:MAG: hypothetical protein DRP74_03390 [Candidatus Omnitrophota bacterium]|nr:MAG: hypothetical protein DRP74_03390 [Candidatus Omnitrophota bacterium]
MNKLRNELASLPDSPGVYLFKDISGKVIYIGKAKSLKKRVQSYFSRYLSAKTQAMIAKVEDLDYKLSSSESQAQILEASLIKSHQPQYNVSLKDDKSFPWIKISDEEFPVVSIVRRKKNLRGDKALYFGPYTNATLLRQAFKMIRRTFGFRTCEKMPGEACLYFRLKLCPGPCINKIKPSDYREIINQICMFLDSKFEELTKFLVSRMDRAAADKRFEEAAGIRDQINALNSIAQSNAPFISNEIRDLKKLLNLRSLPNRIEAFDISNISGKEATGSMVSFYKGLPDKNSYRHFRIKTVQEIDDYKMLSEVIKRRYTKVKKENLPVADLVLIDGGRSHLLTAEREIRKLGMEIPIASIAKGRENIYMQNRKKPIKLNSDTPALNLIRRVRDEAHRFAVAYHHILRRKKIIGK